MSSCKLYSSGIDSLGGLKTQDHWLGGLYKELLGVLHSILLGGSLLGLKKLRQFIGLQCLVDLFRSNPMVLCPKSSYQVSR